MKSNRYIIAFAEVILHLMLGSTYAWSVYRSLLLKKRDGIRLCFAFSLAIFVWAYQRYGAFGKKNLVESHGKSICFSIRGGNILTGFAIDRQELWLLYRLWHFRVGLVWEQAILPLSTIIKWFPDKRGRNRV